MQTLGTIALAITLSAGLALGLGACERERVEVADLDEDAGAASDASADETFPPFPTIDATPDLDATSCGDPPLVGSCMRCPNGYLVVNGKSTCMCCD
ncbi:MAG: hypothetical protein JWP87_5408 [Labilithrix sp.]|nr:hypothetical protein [Labilithrix sp.]